MPARPTISTNELKLGDRHSFIGALGYDGFHVTAPTGEQEIKA